MSQDTYELRHLIWRQMPSGRSTFSTCFNECGQIARGGGECIECLQKKLVKLVGYDLATGYIELARRIRLMESVMDGK